ncbi:MAG: sphingomyelin phosphodiesterase [Alcanivoracaceae bacterium]|nr:sphingomyelin phosphodiesterase [Alcanivoracaceae bacterium]
MSGFRLLIVSVLVLFAGNAAADTYVYITNSTPDPVTISVDHYGSRTLSNGSQWAQEATAIGPYETKRVLRYNRYWGVKSGHTYNFDTRITRNGQSVVAKQTMKGTWSGSNIKHAASGPGFSTSWYTDRNIRSNSHSYASRPSSTAFKSEYTGGYDDFYYVVTNDTLPEPVSGADALKVLSYNIYALPLVATKISERLAELPNHLKGYDVILFQEAFSSDRNGMLQQLAAEYPYQTHVPKIPYSGINVFDSGVLVVSRYPIVATADFIYPDCSGTDCFADKGIIYAEVIKGGKAYHVTSTHTASFDTAEARALRQEQFQQIRALVDAQNPASFDAVMMGGDFNVNKLLWPQDYAQMLTNLNATDPLSTGYTASTFDPRINSLSGAAGSGGETVEYLDYVVYSNTHRQPTQSRNDVRVPRTAVAPLFHTRDLSDHFPVMGEFVFAP